MTWHMAASSALRPTYLTVRKLGGQIWQPRKWEQGILNTLKRKPVLRELVLVRGVSPWKLRTVPGIYDIAQDMDGEYATLPDEVVSHWRAWLAGRRDSPRLVRYAIGTRLRIVKEGSWYGIQATAAHTGPHRARKGFVQVEIPWAGCGAVELSVGDVEAV